jgi:hypothetical protein
MRNIHETVFDLVGAQCDADPQSRSLPEALGLGHIHLQGLAAELALSPDEQDAERLMQQLVTLAAVAVDAASRHVLPALDKEDS